MKRDMTCIVCPLGCAMVVELDEKGGFVSVTGNTCPRGAKYAETECTNPMRTVTTTVKCTDGSVVAVKTDCPVPKDKMADVMKIVSEVIAPLPICVGDVIIENVYGSNIVACANKA